MAVFKIYIILGLVASATVWCSPVSSDKEETNDDFEDDPFGYVQDTLEDFLDSFLEQDNIQVSEDVQINRNNLKIDENEERSSNYGDKLERYIKTHDVTFKIPFLGKVTIENKNLDNEELGFNVKFGENEVEEARKSKLKKILTPILVFFLLKAITLVPLAIGVLLLKAWNSLQLSVFSFIISSGLAIFQLCRKIAENNAQAQISTHGSWEGQALSKQGRSFDIKEAQTLAYSGQKN